MSGSAEYDPQFERIIADNELEVPESSARVLDRSLMCDDFEAAKEQLITESRYEDDDPQLAADYRDFTDRSWREKLVNPRTVAKLRQRALTQLRIDNGGKY